MGIVRQLQHWVGLALGFALAILSPPIITCGCLQIPSPGRR